MGAELKKPTRRGPARKPQSPNFVEFPREPETASQPAGHFNPGYLPDSVAAPWREATACYGHGLLTAFAAMCRVTADAVFADLGERGRLRCYDELEAARELGDIDEASFSAIREVLLDNDPAYSQASLQLDAMQAAVLLEVTKDMLYQVYVRGGKLRSALWMRRHFAAEKSPAAAD